MRKTIMILCFLLLFTACGNERETPSESTSDTCFITLEDVLEKCDFIVKAEYEGTIDHGEYVENKFIVKNVICGQCEERTLLLYANKSWLNDYGKKNESQVSNPEVTESTPEQSTNNKDIVSSSTASYSTKYEAGMEYYIPINIYYDEKGEKINIQTVLALEICPEKSVYRYVNDSIREGGKIISSEEEIVEYLKKYCIYS